MPIRVDDDLPVKKILEDENIFVMGSDRAIRQDIRPLDILILNLMPLKQDAELQLMRSLSNTPLQVNISLIRTMTYESKHAPKGHLERFYTDFSSIKDRKWDGFIITGAPIEKMEFEDVEYWDELKEIMDWSEKNVTSTIHICWGAQAGLYYRYGVQKYELDKKLSGIYMHHTFHRKTPLVRGFDDIFYVPHSRYTGVDKDEIVKNPHLEIVGLMCKEVVQRAKEQLEIILVVRDSVKKHIVETGSDKKYGARPLRRAVQSQLEDKLAEALLNGEIKRGDHVEAGISKKEIKFTVREINS